MDEWIDVLDERGGPTGETVLKSEAHRLGLWHRCFHCWILGTDSAGEPYVLVQRRAKGKVTWPGYLDVSVAGHLTAWEEPLDGRREIEEEIGLEVSPERLTYLGERRVDREIPQGRDREFHAVFLLFDSTSPEKLRLQRGEVEAVLSVKLPDAEALAAGETVPAVEHAEGRESPVRIGPRDFVPGGGDYLRRVFSATRRAIAGEPVGEVF